MVDTKRYIVGCMTGTSLDGLDAALVEISGSELNIKAKMISACSRSLHELAFEFHHLTAQEKVAPGHLAYLAYQLGIKHAAAIRKLTRARRVDLVAVHGQTIYHMPPLSMQLINVHPIAHRLGIPVVYDFRSADLALGGEGAPITPISDHILYRDETKTRVVLNLGGYINFTWLTPAKRENEASLKSIRGGDICACNQLLDAIARTFLNAPFDEFGQHAMGGDVLSPLYDYFYSLLKEQSNELRSLGTGDDLHNAVKAIDTDEHPSAIARSACAAIAQVIANSIGDADELIVAGGSVKNSALMREIRERADATVIASDDLGIPSAYREAISMAVLGALCEDGYPITLPKVTGVSSPAPLGGSWVYPLGYRPMAYPRSLDETND